MFKARSFGTNQTNWIFKLTYLSNKLESTPKLLKWLVLTYYIATRTSKTIHFLPIYRHSTQAYVIAIAIAEWSHKMISYTSVPMYIKLSLIHI